MASTAHDAQVWLSAQSPRYTPPILDINITGDAGSVSGTVGGIPVDTVTDGAANGGVAFDQTVNYRNNTAPSHAVIAALAPVITNNSDGSRDIALTWSYTQGAVAADGFILFYRQGTGTVLSTDPGYQLPATARSYRFQGVPQEVAYRAGIAAYRRTDSGLLITAIYQPTSAPDWRVSAATPVITAQLGIGLVTTTTIADDAITTPKIAANAVTAAELAANAVTASKLQAGTAVVTETLQLGSNIVTVPAFNNTTSDVTTVGTLEIVTLAQVTFATGATPPSTMFVIAAVSFIPMAAPVGTPTNVILAIKRVNASGGTYTTVVEVNFSIYDNLYMGAVVPFGDTAALSANTTYIYNVTVRKASAGDPNVKITGSSIFVLGAKR